MKEQVGLKDRNGVEICDGDMVNLYPLNHPKTLISEGEGHLVYEVNTSIKLPAPDIALARGKIAWSTSRLAWVIEISWASWEPQPASVFLGDSGYEIEVYETSNN